MERAQYQVTERSFIDGLLLEEGAKIHFDGAPGSKLRPLNEAAEAAAEKAKQDAEARRRNAGAVPLHDSVAASLADAIGTAIASALKPAKKTKAEEPPAADA
jgi:hypothetical protein